MYSFSILTQGSSRRCRLTSSRNRVNSFSRVSRSLRATSHSTSDIMRGSFSCLVSTSISCGFIWFPPIWFACLLFLKLDFDYFAPPPVRLLQSASRNSRLVFFNPFGIAIRDKIQSDLMLKECFEPREYQREPLGRSGHLFYQLVPLTGEAGLSDIDEGGAIPLR